MPTSCAGSGRLSTAPLTGPTRGWRPGLPLRLGDVATTQFHRERHDFKASLAHAPNVTLLLHAPAVDLATDEDPGRVDRDQVRRADGSSCFVRARLIVLAAGGNARGCPPNRRCPPRWSPVRSRPVPAAWVAGDEVDARTRACAIRCANTVARCCGCRRIDVSPNRGVRPTPPGWEARAALLRVGMDRAAARSRARHRTAPPVHSPQ